MQLWEKKIRGVIMNSTNIKIEEMILWLKEKVNDANAKGLVFGLSGGIDSAVLAALSKKAFPKTTLGIIMPCHSQDEDEEDARYLAEKLNIDITKVKLDNVYDILLEESDLKCSSDLAKSNIKPRLRMTTLYYYAQSLNYLVAGGTNKSEFTIGYFTKHGDTGVDILPLIKWNKREVYEVAEALDIPKKIIEKVPSAGLLENQSDEEDMGFSYETLEKYMNGEEISEEIFKKINNMDKRSNHKRQFPLMYD